MTAACRAAVSPAISLVSSPPIFWNAGMGRPYFFSSLLTESISSSENWVSWRKFWDSLKFFGSIRMNPTGEIDFSIQVLNLRSHSHLEEVRAQRVNAINYSWHVLLIVYVCGFRLKGLEAKRRKLECRRPIELQKLTRFFYIANSLQFVYIYDIVVMSCFMLNVQRDKNSWI